MYSSIPHMLLQHSSTLCQALETIPIPKDIIAYNVFDYAWNGWEQYIKKYAHECVPTLILGINPGPHGMVQTGIPFGAVSKVTQFLRITPQIHRPAVLHPKRPVVGIQYSKDEPSGLRLWNEIQSIFTSPERFSKNGFVLNYCPLAFFDKEGKNLTPDKIPLQSRHNIETLCTKHLRAYIDTMKISRVLGVGRYASKKAEALLAGTNIPVHYIPHPSPLNPQHKEFNRVFRTMFGHDSV